MIAPGVLRVTDPHWSSRRPSGSLWAGPPGPGSRVVTRLPGVPRPGRLLSDRFAILRKIAGGLSLSKITMASGFALSPQGPGRQNIFG